LDILFSYEFTENEQAKMYHLSMDCSCQFWGCSVNHKHPLRSWNDLCVNSNPQWGLLCNNHIKAKCTFVDRFFWVLGAAAAWRGLNPGWLVKLGKTLCWHCHGLWSEHEIIRYIWTLDQALHQIQFFCLTIHLGHPSLVTFELTLCWYCHALH
jgi:hypothetical protein